MKMPRLLLLTSILFCCHHLVFGQSWIRIDTMFNPSGVSVLNWSAPEIADLDADGDMDLILGNGSVEPLDFFQSIGTKNAPKFKKDTTVFGPLYASGFVGMNSDYPVIVDLTGDSLPDLIIGGYNGLVYFKNIGATGQSIWSKDTSVFFAVDTLIGTDAKPAFADLDGDGDFDLLIGIGESLFGGPTPGITMGFRNVGSKTAPVFTQDNTLVTGIPDIGLNAYPTLKDLDGDGDNDLLLGRDLATLVYYQNTGTAAAPVWTSSTLFSVVESKTYWKDPVLADFDLDGDFDLLYGTADGTLFFYENVGTKMAPQFQSNANYFTLIRLDGNGATTSLGDFDRDGDLDLLSGDWLGKFQYFRNDGTARNPKFVKATAAFSSIDVGSYSSPVFVDLDQDGDLDIISGALSGGLSYYVNNGSTFQQNMTLFSSISVGYRSAPAFADLDNDGDLDMLVGAEDANRIRCFRNTGGTFISDSTMIYGLVSERDGHPAFSDLDGDGDYDIILGSSWGEVLGYENVGTRFSPTWSRNNKLIAGMEVHQSATPIAGDLDGDGQDEVIVGEYNGNFSYFKKSIPQAIWKGNISTPGGFEFIQNYPNPFNPATTFRFRLSQSGLVTLKVHDLIGREVAVVFHGKFEDGEYEWHWIAESLPSGAYFYRLETKSGIHGGKLLLLR